jgi:hypothetical protein
MKNVGKQNIFENRFLSIVFALQREEITGGWKKVNNEGLHNLYSSTNFVRVID